MKRYVDAPHSEEVAHLMDETLAIRTSAVSRVELGAALARAARGDSTRMVSVTLNSLTRQLSPPAASTIDRPDVSDYGTLARGTTGERSTSLCGQTTRRTATS